MLIKFLPFFFFNIMNDCKSSVKTVNPPCQYYEAGQDMTGFTAIFISHKDLSFRENRLIWKACISRYIVFWLTKYIFLN